MAHFILFVCASLVVVVKLAAMHIAVSATEVANYASGQLNENAVHYERRQPPPRGILRNTPANRPLFPWFRRNLISCHPKLR